MPAIRRPPLRTFRRLSRHFLSGIVDQDLIASGEDLHTPLAGMLAAFLVFSAAVALLFVGKYNSVRLTVHGSFRPAQFQTLADKLGMAVDDKTLLFGGVMLVMGLLTVLFWDTFVLDERDATVLGPLPVGLATALFAKATAALCAAIVVAIALNVLPAVLFPLVVLAKAPVGLVYVAQSIAAHAVAGLAGCAFVFLSVFSLRTLLGVLLPPRVTRRLLPLLQSLIVLTLVSLLLALPLLASGARGAIERVSWSIFWLPPLWFLGLEEVLIARSGPVITDLARLGLVALGSSILAACLMPMLTLAWRSPHAALTAGSPSSLLRRAVAAFVGRMARLVAKDGRARASFLFTAHVLTRSPHHRLYLAGAFGVGVAVAGLTVGAVYAGVGLGPLSLSLTTMGLAAQLNLIFFVVIGARMAMTVPADLEAGWIFRFHATPALQRHLAGTRGAIFFLLLLPVLFLLIPLHAHLWGGYVAVVHFAFGVVTALGLLEVVFAGYTRLPFVSPFTPGRRLLSPRLGLYAVGYLLFVYLTPGIEQLLVTRTAMFYPWVAMLTVLVARFITSQSTHARGDRLASFDGPDGGVHQLGLGYTGRDQRSPDRASSTAMLEAPAVFGALWGRSRAHQRAAGLNWGWTANQLQREVVQAVRRLRRAPGFTVFAVLSLALGIGITTAIYSVVYGTIFRPLQVHDRDRLVNIYHSSPFAGSRSLIALSQPDFEDFRAMQTVFTHVAAHAPFRQVVIVDGAGERVIGEVVSGEYFSTLGVRPALGRGLQPADDRPNAAPVAVVDDRTWRRRFQSRPDVIGQTIRMGGHAFEIVGVAPPDFHGVELPNLAPAAIWIPLSAAPLVIPPQLEQDREARYLFAKGRLAPGRTIAEATAELRVIGRRLDEVSPIGRTLEARFRTPPSVKRVWTALPSADRIVTERADTSIRWIARLLMVAVGLVLLVACTNVANLMLARGTSRRRELAVRVALGASRWQVVREQLVESALVAALSALVAFAVARALISGDVGTTVRLGPWASVDVVPRLDWPVLLVGLAATGLALLVSGLGPALQLTGGGCSIVNAGDGGAGVSARWRGRRWLIASQVAVSVALVAVASVSVQQLLRAASRDAGFDLNRLALVRFDFTAQGWSEARARRALEGIRAEVGAQPGVEAVSIGSGLPGGSTGGVMVNLASPDRPFDLPRYYGHRLTMLTGTPGLFTTLGLSILRGRAFSEDDQPGAVPVIILSERAARDLFGSSDVVGRQVLRLGPVSHPEARSTVAALTVVGIARDVAAADADGQQDGLAYMPFAQDYGPYVAVIARASADPAPALAALKAVAARLEPELGIVDAGTGPALGNAENLAFEVTASLAGPLGLVALMLAMVGLYGVLSYVVTQRSHEMAVRVALGASEPHIMRLVLRDALRPVVEGLVVGFVLGDLAVMAMRPAFVRPAPIDSTILVVVPGLFLAAALVASYLPSRRAARVPPNVALRNG